LIIIDDKKVREIIDSMEEQHLHSFEISYYLNKKTYEIVSFSSETIYLFEDYTDDELQEKEIPDWQMKDLEEYEKVCESSDYVSIEEIES